MCPGCKVNGDCLNYVNGGSHCAGLRVSEAMDFTPFVDAEEFTASVARLFGEAYSHDARKEVTMEEALERVVSLVRARDMIQYKKGEASHG